MTVERVLMGIRKGAPDYAEEVITNNPLVFVAAEGWARANGFDRFRVMEVDLGTVPDFGKSVNA